MGGSVLTELLPHENDRDYVATDGPPTSCIGHPISARALLISIYWTQYNLTLTLQILGPDSSILCVSTIGGRAVLAVFTH